MSEKLKSIILRIVDEAWNNGKLDVMDEFCSTNFIRYIPPFEKVEGLEAFKDYVTSIRKAFPDLHLKMDEFIIEGDNLAARWEWTGMHSGESPRLRIPPTGKRVITTGCSLIHFQEGKLIDEWAYSDNLGMLQQLGVIPPLG